MQDVVFRFVPDVKQVAKAMEVCSCFIAPDQNASEFLVLVYCVLLYWELGLGDIWVHPNQHNRIHCTQYYNAANCAFAVAACGDIPYGTWDTSCTICPMFHRCTHKHLRVPSISLQIYFLESCHLIVKNTGSWQRIGVFCQSD